MTDRPHYKPKTQKNAKGVEGHWITWEGRHIFLRGARKVAGKEKSRAAAGGSKPLEFAGAAGAGAAAARTYRGAVKEGDRTRVIERARAAAKVQGTPRQRKADMRATRNAQPGASLRNLHEKIAARTPQNIPHAGTTASSILAREHQRRADAMAARATASGKVDIARREEAAMRSASETRAQRMARLAANRAARPAPAPAQPSLKEQAAAHRAKKGKLKTKEGVMAISLHGGGQEYVPAKLVSANDAFRYGIRREDGAYNVTDYATGMSMGRYYTAKKDDVSRAVNLMAKHKVYAVPNSDGRMPAGLSETASRNARRISRALRRMGEKS